MIPLSGLPNYFAAISAMPVGLFRENLSVALSLADVSLPDFGQARIDWVSSYRVIALLETAAQALHELDGLPRRLPVHSLYFRLFGGAVSRPPAPQNIEECGAFLNATASLFLSQELDRE